MKPTKLVKSLKEAIQLVGLKDGMTISFHHHFRNGDLVINQVLDAIADLGIKDLKINSSAIFECHKPLIDHVKNHVVTDLETNFISAGVGRVVSTGKLFERPVTLNSHGGRDSLITTGKSHIDVAFIGAPTADPMGNYTGKYGPSACGSIGYSFADAMCADKVIVLTDNLVPYPLADFSVPETYVDYVVTVDKIGEASGIATGILKPTKDPVGQRMAKYVAKVIEHSGAMEDECFGYQAGGGSVSITATKYLKDVMLAKGMQGDFIMGGVTGYAVDLLESGCFRTIYDAQDMDIAGIESLRKNPNHKEISIGHYASPTDKSCVVDRLSAAILGATEIDVDFNVNVNTDSNGYIIGGSGGHQDVAAGAAITMMVAPLYRARLPIVVDKCTIVTTPGSTVDVLITQRGIAVNPARPELKDRLKDAGLPIVDILELKAMAEKITGKPDKVTYGDKVVANVLYRGLYQIDTIHNVIER